MKNAVLIALAGLVLAAITGCASTTYQGTRDVQAGQTFTAEEKEAMTQEERVAVYNEQVREKDRLICRKEKRTGSHRSITVCRTVEEKEADETSARDALMRARGPTGNPTTN